MQHSNPTGDLTLHGEVKAVRQKDLGDLRTAPLMWRIKNFWQHKHRSMPAAVASQFLGRTMGVLTFTPTLSAGHVRPNPMALGMTPFEWTRLREYLRMNVPIDQIPTLVPKAERWLKFQHALRENVHASSLIGPFGISVLDYGVLSHRKVTTAGVAFLVDAWQNSVELENMKYHGCGTGTNAESNGDTALQTESTTALNPDSTRATGSLTESAANVFRTVGTLTFDAGAAVTEHGILSQAATGGGTLWDRSVFSAINVVSADSIQFTYDLTANAEA